MRLPYRVSGSKQIPTRQAVSGSTYEVSVIFKVVGTLSHRKRWDLVPSEETVVSRLVFLTSFLTFSCYQLGLQGFPASSASAYSIRIETNLRTFTSTRARFARAGF